MKTAKYELKAKVMYLVVRHLSDEDGNYAGEEPEEIGCFESLDSATAATKLWVESDNLAGSFSAAIRGTGRKDR